MFLLLSCCLSSLLPSQRMIQQSIQDPAYHPNLNPPTPCPVYLGPSELKPAGTPACVWSKISSSVNDQKLLNHKLLVPYGFLKDDKINTS